MISAILKYSIGSLAYGGLITVIFLSLFILLIKGWYKDAVFKPISFIVLGVLALIVLCNGTIFCGAQAMKSDISSVKASIENIIETSGLDVNTGVDSLQSNKIFQEAANRHPALNYYASHCDFSGRQLAGLPSAICDTLNGYLNGIIVKCLLWTLVFAVAGAIAVIKTLDRSSGGRASGRVPRNAGRTRTIASRNGGRRKSSRI